MVTLLDTAQSIQASWVFDCCGRPVDDACVHMRSNVGRAAEWVDSIKMRGSPRGSDGNPSLVLIKHNILDASMGDSTRQFVHMAGAKTHRGTNLMDMEDVSVA